MKKREAIKPIRRQQLIQATLEVIERVGLADASFVLIAKQAGLSTGIISHYFGDKNGLLSAVMHQIMQDLSNDTLQRRQALMQANDDSALSQIKAIIDSNLAEEQTDGPVMKTWLAFWAASMHQPSLRRLNKINERRLYSNLFYYFCRELSREKAHLAAVGLAALIEGLWLRVALSGDSFDPNMSRVVAYEYLKQQLQSPESE